MATFGVTEHAKEVVYESIFEWVQDSSKYCEGCPYNECTKDAYSTGDSPTLCECTTSEHNECIGVDMELDENYGEWFDQWTE